MKKTLSIFMTLLVGLALSGCVFEPSTTEEVVFSLSGDNVIELDIGEEYIELGFTASIADVDFSSSVSVSGTVDNTISGVYRVEYTLVSDGVSYKLLRFIIINDNEIGDINFRLIGDTIIELSIGEEYIEEGFFASIVGESLVESVVIEGEVDENTEGIYFLEYVLSYNEEEIRLLRAVSVIEDDFADPDIILYDGVCDNVEIHYISLGAMGDSTLIDCGDFEIIIDAGLKSGGTNVVVPYLEDFVDDDTIELLIATHPDADHIGGFVGLAGTVGVFDAFTIERVLDYGYTKTTTTHTQYAELRDNSGALICNGDDAINGRNLCQPYYTITEDLILRVIDTGHYATPDSTNDNENSIVVVLEHMELRYLFTGDAEFVAEAYMAQSIEQVDVYKAGHHGSKTASSAVFLEAITPSDIILSVYFPDDDDEENAYGIPQQESLDRLFGQTDNIYTTGTNGHIIIVSNGITYTINGSENSLLFKDSAWFSTHRTYPIE